MCIYTCINCNQGMLLITFSPIYYLILTNLTPIQGAVELGVWKY